MKNIKKHLKEILLEANIIDEEKLNRAMELRDENGGRLSDILLQQN